MLPMKVWLAVFAIGTPLLLYRGLIDPIWAALGGCYFYFAIPTVEFAAPEGPPYQAAFWALAALGSLRHRAMARRDATGALEAAAVAAGREALAAALPALEAAAVAAAPGASALGEVRERALAAAEAPAFQSIDRRAPRALALVVRRAVRQVLEEGSALAERESLALADAVGRATEGTRRSALALRLGPSVQALLEARVADAVLREVRAAVAAADAAGDRAAADGPLGVPMPRGPLAGLLSNVGLWAILTFTLLTFLGAGDARYDAYKALRKFDTCTLLLIPAIAIVCAVRDARQVRLFALAWVAGTLHLAMNGVTWWLQNGGRADNPGGQGGESNYLGAVIVTIAPVTYGMVLDARSWRWRGLGAALAAVFLLGLLASGSRAALIAAVASGGYWLLHTHRKGLALGGAAVASACFMLVAPGAFWERMGTILGEEDRNPWVVQRVEASKHERQVLWGLALDVFAQNPVWGIGPGQFNFVSAEQTEFTDPYQQRRGLQTHNTWLQLAAEYGAVGTCVWAGAFAHGILCYGRARRRLAKRPGCEALASLCLGLEAGAIGSAIVCTFNSFQWYDYQYWFFVYAPLVLQVAKETVERLDWLSPLEPEGPRAPAGREAPWAAARSAPRG